MDLLSLAFIRAMFLINMKHINGFGKENCLSLLSLGWRCYNTRRTEEDEPNYDNKDNHMRHFVQRKIKRRKVGAFIQIY